MQGVQGRSLVRNLISHMMCRWKIKTLKKKSNIVTNSLKTLKVVHIQKDLEEKKCKSQCSFIGGAWIWPVNHSGLWSRLTKCCEESVVHHKSVGWTHLGRGGGKQTCLEVIAWTCLEAGHPVFSFSAPHLPSALLWVILQPSMVPACKKLGPPWAGSLPGACSYSCPSSWWWHPTISSSVVPFWLNVSFISMFGNDIHTVCSGSDSTPPVNIPRSLSC